MIPHYFGCRSCSACLPNKSNEIANSNPRVLTILLQEDLQGDIRQDALLEQAEALQDIAYDTPKRNRFLGTQGHNDTVKWIYNQLTSPSLDGYYNVTLQPWIGRVQLNGTGSLKLNGVNTDIVLPDYSPTGNASGVVVVVKGLGCDPVSATAALCYYTLDALRLTVNAVRLSGKSHR